MQRFMMVVRYWWPTLRTQFWVFLGISVLCSVASGFMDRELNIIFGLYIISLTPWMAYLGPVIFGRSRGKDFDIALPVANSEKMIFMAVYSIIILPLITYGLSTLIYSLIAGYRNSEANLSMYLNNHSINPDLIFNHRFIVVLNSIISSVMFSSITLYGAINYKVHAVAKSILTTIACVILPSFLLGLGCGLYGFYVGYTEYEDMGVKNLEILRENMYNHIFYPYMWIMITLGIVVTTVLAINYVRRFPKRQAV